MLLVTPIPYILWAMNTIEAEAQIRLRRSDILELHHVRCTFHRGVLTLHGIVSNSHARQVAQELIADLEGIDIMDNQLTLVSDKTA
jgi:osmotically-inducible protein OsmY